MPRKIGWEDQTITGGRRGDGEHKFRGKEGETFVIRVMTDCEEFRQHSVDDVLEPDKKTNEPRVFNLGCAKDWSDKDEDWVGECLACERDYDLQEKYIAGVLVVGSYKGRSKTANRIDPENACFVWDFGGDKYRALSDLALELARAKTPKKLAQVELTVKCEDEKFQKLTINLSQAEPLTTKAHVQVWKEEGEKLLDAAKRPPKIEEQKRALKKRTKRRDDDSRGGDDDEKESAKSRRRAKDDEPKDEPEENDAPAESSGDAELDDLLSEL